jgi:hypothetical protein
MDRYCTESEQALGYEEFHGYATEYGEPEGPIPSYEELLGIVKGTPEEVYTIGNTNMYNTTILPDKASWTVGFNTEYIFEHEMTLVG